MSDIAVYQQPSEIAVIDHRDIDSWITVVSDVIKIANVIADTPFVPDGLRGSAPAVAAAILAGREMGLGMMTSLANFDVIKGKPTQKALLMRALIQAQGHKWEDVDVSDSRAVIRACRKGESKWTEVTFTRDQARTAGIDLGKYPADKLYARATSRLARRKFADVVMGMPYSPEDLEDGDDAEIGTLAEANGSAPAPAPAAPKPRTAQRRQRQAASNPVAKLEAPPQEPRSADPSLPPLPGEDEDPTVAPQPATASPPSASAEGDERGHDSPGTVTNRQLAAIWIQFKDEFGFADSDEDKERARAVAGHIINHALGSTREMSRNQAKTVLDTMAHWRDIAERRGVAARSVLDTEMAVGGPEDSGDAPDGGA